MVNVLKVVKKGILRIPKIKYVKNVNHLARLALELLA